MTDKKSTNYKNIPIVADDAYSQLRDFLPDIQGSIFNRPIEEISEVIRSTNDIALEKADHRQKASTQASPNANSFHVPLGIRQYLTKEEGEGFWETLQIRPGLYLSIVEAFYHKDFKITIMPDPLIKIRILLSGTLKSSPDHIIAESGDIMLHSLSGDHPETLIIEKSDTPFRFIVINCQPRAVRGMGLLPQSLGSPFREAMSEEELPNMTINFPSVKLRHLGHDIMNSRDNFFFDTRKTLLAAKAEELLCEAIEKTRPKKKINAGKNKVSDKDLSRLYEARNILDSNISAPPKITDLARMVGLNTTKLKLGFKELFSETISGFVSRSRVEQALDLVENSDLSFSEIGYRVGYNYPANFTTSFRKILGKTPSEIRLQKRQLDDTNSP